MNLERPLRKDNVLCSPLDSEWILCDSESGSVHFINATAEFVWSMCDGYHSLNDMEEQLRDAYHFPNEIDLKRELDTILQKFKDMKILAQSHP